MAMANLDLQDLNALLKSYVNEYHELEKNIGDLQLINLRFTFRSIDVCPPCCSDC